MDLKDVLTKMVLLNKKVRQNVMLENYTIFKKFIRQFSLNKRLKKSDLPAYIDVFKLIKDNMVIRHEKSQRIQPFVFFTDSGVDQESYQYFMHQLFGEGSYCYCTRQVDLDKNGAHLQAYLGRRAMHNELRPMDFRKEKNDPMVIQLPIE